MARSIRASEHRRAEVDGSLRAAFCRTYRRQITIDDPGVFTRSIPFTPPYILMPDTELQEHYCVTTNEARSTSGEPQGGRSAEMGGCMRHSMTSMIRGRARRITCSAVIPLRPERGVRIRSPVARIALAVACLSAPAHAQWLNHPTPSIPRNADGTPRLDTPPPRLPDGRPDLEGVWTSPRVLIMPPADVLQPWARARMQAHHETFLRDRPAYRCLPNGPEVNADWKRIVQSRSTVVILNDNQTYRTIFLDGRVLEADPHPSWMGYSVGRWDGDTLVVESNGFNDRTWLNPRGLPHTTRLRVVERYTRRSVGRIELEITIDDPGAFVRPWTATVPLELRADTEMLETVCEENSDRWAGTMSQVRANAVVVPPETLARYVGTYRGLWGTTPRTVRVVLDGGTLRANDVYGHEVQLIPESPTFFAGTDGLTYEFVAREGAPATHVVERHVSGDYTYAREP
jgi:hypothetical protein